MRWTLFRLFQQRSGTWPIDGVDRARVSVHRFLWIPLAAALGAPVHAADPLPGAVDPGQLEKRFQSPPAPRARPDVVIPERAAPMPPDEASTIRFVLTAVEVNNATVFSAADFRPLYKELLNREISLLDIYRLAGQITAQYGNAGYVLARAIVPPQVIKDGVVRIQAVEGYVDRVVFEGNPPQRALFQYYASRIRASRPLQAAVLERYLLLANDLAGVRVQSVLRPSTDNTGAATLVLEAETDRFEGLVSLDNRGTEAVGPVQLFAEAKFNSLLNPYGQSILRAATTPLDARELVYVQVGHNQVFNGEGTAWSVTAAHSGSEPGTPTLRLLEVKSESQSLGLSVFHPLIRSRSRNLALTAALDHRSGRSELLGITTARDRHYILRGSLLFDRADAWGGINLVNSELSRSIDVADAQVESRQQVPLDFTLISLRASRTQRVGDRWLVIGRLAAQAAGSALPTAELFALGGESLGRGYDPSEWVGDQGAAASVEVAYRPIVSWAAHLQTSVFYDQGTVWRRRPLDESESQSASSAGVGVQVGGTRGWSVALEAAKPLGERANSSNGNDWRGFGRVMVRF